MAAQQLYLVHGDDNAKIGTWRTRLRRRAEEAHGPGGLELFEGKEGAPDAVAAGLTTLSFAEGTRYLLADDVDGWKPGDLDPLLTELANMPPDVVLVMLARGKVPEALAKAVQKAGGEVRACQAPKPWDIPKWAAERAREEGLQMDAEAVNALAAATGPSQQRVMRELEKLSLAVHPSKRVSADDVAEYTGGAASPDVYALAEALVAGDPRTSQSISERLCEGGERPGGLTYRIVTVLRETHRTSQLLDAGATSDQVAKALRMPAWRAKKALARARKTDRDALERALWAFADFEVETRGGGQLGERTAFSLALAKASGARAA